MQEDRTIHQHTPKAVTNLRRAAEDERINDAIPAGEFP